MPYSTGCCTSLSNFEAGQNYKDVDDPAVTVAFALDDDPDDAQMVAWTTTPWTLPSNLSLCVNTTFDYVKARARLEPERRHSAPCRPLCFPVARVPRYCRRSRMLGHVL